MVIITLNDTLFVYNPIILFTVYFHHNKYPLIATNAGRVYIMSSSEQYVKPLHKSCLLYVHVERLNCILILTAVV